MYIRSIMLLPDIGKCLYIKDVLQNDSSLSTSCKQGHPFNYKNAINIH